MTPEEFQRVCELFSQVAELTPAARSAHLDRACQGDPDLRREVESLLAHRDKPLDALDSPLAGEVPRNAVESVLDDSSAEPIPPKAGKYRILRRLGQGGMGTIYLAEQDNPRRTVALKMIRLAAMSPKMLRRFQSEADLLGRLQHPGIAQIYEAGRLDTVAGSQPYFAMEHVEGLELRQYAAEHGLGVRSKLELVARVCDAVQHAHQRGVLHRDLKPENVLVVDPPTTAAGQASEFTSLGQPKVLDFGVARATDSDIQMTTMQTGFDQLIGTVAYMSPEQAIGDSRRLDGRSDIYALGVILYELLARRPPLDLRHRSIPEAVRTIREEEPTRLSSIDTVFRGDIDAIVAKALEKDRDRRYQSAADLATDIRRWLASEPIAARPASAIYQVRKFAKRNRGLVAGLGLALVILLIGTVTSLIFAIQASRGEQRAIREEESAKKSKQRAVLGEEAARRAAYRLHITAADAVGDTDPIRALEHLDQVPAEFRNWEWRYLRARFQPHIAELVDRNTDAGAGYGWLVRPAYAGTVAYQAGEGLVAALERRASIEIVRALSGKVAAVFKREGGLAFPTLSPDGSKLAALGRTDRTLIVWDVDSHACLLEMDQPAARVIDVRFSPDGRHLAIHTRKDRLTVLDLTTGGSVLELDAWAGAPRVTFSPLGDRIAYIRRELLKLTSLDGRPIASRPRPGGGCASLAFSPDGSQLAVGGAQRGVHLLDASTLEQTAVFLGHDGPVTAVVFSPDGGRLASGSDDGTTRVWNLATGRVEHVFAGSSNRRPATSVLFSPDGRTLIAANARAARVWPLPPTTSRLLPGHNSYVYRVAFSPDGLLLASGAFRGRARLWDALTGEAIAVLGAEGPHRWLSFTPDGSRLVAKDSAPQADARKLSFWDCAAGRRLTAPRSEADEPLFTGQSSMWSVIAGGAKRVGEAGECQALNSDRTLVAKGTPAGEVLVRDAGTAQVIRRITGHGCAVLAVAFHPDSTRLVFGDESGHLKVWDWTSGVQLAAARGHNGNVYSVTYSPDGTRIVSGGNDSVVMVWDADSLAQVLMLRGHRGYVHSVSFSPDGSQLASGSGDGTVRLWDAMPPVARWQEIQAAKNLRRQAEPLVDRLLSEMSDELDVADHLRADSTLDEGLRNAALSMLLRRSGTGSPDRP